MEYNNIGKRVGVHKFLSQVANSAGANTTTAPTLSDTIKVIPEELANNVQGDIIGCKHLSGFH